MSRERHAGNPAPKTPELVNECPANCAKVLGILQRHSHAEDLLTLLGWGNLGTVARRSCHGVVFRLARPRGWILSTLAEKFSIFCTSF